MSSSDKMPDMSRAFGDFSKSLNKLIDTLEGTTRTAGRGTAGGRAGTDHSGKGLRDLTKQLETTEKALDKLQSGAEDVTKSHKELFQAQTDLTKGLVKNQKLSELSQDRMRAVIALNIKEHSFFGESMHKAAQTAETLEKKLEETGHFLSEYNSLLKDTNAESLSSINNSKDLEKAVLRLTTGMKVSDEVQQMINKKDYASAAKALDNEAKNASVIRESVKKTSVGFLALNNASSALKTGVSKVADIIGGDFLKGFAELGGGTALLIAGLKQGYEQFKVVASSGFGGTFLSLSKDAISLGISLESLTKIAKENQVLVGKLGLDGFTDTLKQTQSQLMQLGLSTEEAAKAKAVMVENSFLSGVDINNKKALNDSTQQQIAAYSDLRSTTGETIEMLAQQTKSILQSNDAMKIMTSMNRQQRSQMVQDINLERARLTTLGLTNEAAMEMVKTVQAISNEKATTRIDQAAKLQAGGQMLGMDAGETDKISQILMKSKGSRSAEDVKTLNDYAMKANKAAGGMQGSGADISSQIQGDIAEDLLGPLKGLGEQGAGANLGRGLTEDQKNANKANAKVPAAIADTSAKIESGMQLLHSPLLKIVAGVTGILAWLARGTISNAINKTLGVNPGSSIASKIMPGSSVQGLSRMNGIVANGSGPLTGISALRAAETKIAGSGIDSLGSTRLQERVAANRKMVAARGTGAASNVAGAAAAARGSGSLVAKGAGLITKSIGGIARLGLKAIPFLGWAVAAFEGITGAFDGVEKAASIFGVDVNKDALTTAQKVSAGIAGALHSISFGLIPLDSTAKLLNDVAEDGVGTLTDMWDGVIEGFYNKVVPMVWSGFKSILGFLADTFLDAMNPKTWINVFTGGGNGGFVDTLMSSIWHGLEFLAVALSKGVVKFGADIVDKITSYLPKWMVPEALSNLGEKNTWASSDTHMSDFDSPEQAQARANRAAKKAKRDGTTTGTDGVVQGMAAGSLSSQVGYDSAGNPIGLTADQLASQGIMGSPASNNTPGVVGPNGTTQISPAGTVINNNNTNAPSAPPKTQAETLLSGILDKMTSLVDLTSQGLKISQDGFKMASTSSRISGGTMGTGYSPSMTALLEML